MQLLRSTCRPVPTLCGRWKPTSSGQEPHQSAVALRPVTHPSEREQSLLLFLLLQFGTLAISLQRPVSESKVTRNNSDLL